MKKIALIIIFLSIAAFANPQSKKSVQQTFYTCVMHPEIHKNELGKCLKHGMTLVKGKVKTQKKSGNKIINCYQKGSHNS